MSTTLDALVGRGVDNTTAESLVGQRYTISRLKRLSKRKLHALGIHDDAIEAILDDRPPIPPALIHKLLYESRWACCVCRTGERLVIHHLTEWAESKSHEASNLVVLCLNHHDEAHTIHSHARSLTRTRLLRIKREWLRAVQRSDSLVMRGYCNHPNVYWDYISQARLQHLAKTKGISIRSCDHAKKLIRAGVIDDNGSLTWPIARSRAASRAYYLFGMHHDDSALTFDLYEFRKSLLTRVLDRTGLVDVTNRWTSTVLSPFCESPAPLLLTDAPYTIQKRSHGSTTLGRDQLREFRHRRNGICVRFTIDVWEAMGSTPYGRFVGGRSSLTAIWIPRYLRRDSGVFAIDATCLAIGTFDKQSASAFKRNGDGHISY